MLHQLFDFHLEFVEGIDEGMLAPFLAKPIGNCTVVFSQLFHFRNLAHVFVSSSATDSALYFIVLRAGYMHHLHPAHFKSLNSCHIDLGHVVLPIARVDVLCYCLGLIHDEPLALIDAERLLVIMAALAEGHVTLVVAEPSTHVLRLGYRRVLGIIGHGPHQRLLRGERRSHGRGSGCAICGHFLRFIDRVQAK